MESNIIVNADCLEYMRGMEDNCIDTIITDPPYGLSFMGKKWDYDVPAIETWQECLRVLKPGGTLLCFAGTRTYHRMVCNIEDAGFIPKDCIMWLYGSGFPKATDISKQLDKGHERKVVGEKADPRYQSKSTKGWREYRKGNTGESDTAAGSLGCYEPGQIKETAPATPEAQLWNGWKSHGLKPAYEPILVAMKPNEGTYAENALKWGVSGLNIDGGRIAGETPSVERRKHAAPKESIGGTGWVTPARPPSYNEQRAGELLGRFPANVILDEEAGRMLDEQSGELGNNFRKSKANGSTSIFGSGKSQPTTSMSDSGGASRFFYCAKASKKERNAGCGGTGTGVGHDATFQDCETVDWKQVNGNHHPTVKPLDLMEYLCTLTKTPTGGIVLDPFLGSGTTAAACVRTGREYIGIEKDEDEDGKCLGYIKIARKRIQEAKDSMGLFK